jgi:hypothetical protein
MGFIDVVKRFFNKDSALDQPADPVPTIDGCDAIIVAEVHFNRNASPDEFKKLGEALAACMKNHGWIARITGLNELLKGESPMHYSRAIGNSVTGEITPFYDPVLIWGKLNYPGTREIAPVKILREAIPSSLGSVSYPDPDGGL